MHYYSIGSLAKDLKEEGVQNVTVKAVTFTGTQNGVRIKSWARPSNGFVKHVVFQHIDMTNVQHPIVIDQNYCPRHKNCPGKVQSSFTIGLTKSPMNVIGPRLTELYGPYFSTGFGSKSK